MREFDISAYALSDNASCKGEFHIVLKPGIVRELHLRLKMELAKGRIMILTDANARVAAADFLLGRLLENGFDVTLWSFPAGESGKSMSALSSFLECLSASAFTKSDLILSVGGGVCADIAAMASSLYMGGIDFIHVPTTLASACDSRIGGISRIGLLDGIGFCEVAHFPLAVYIDTDVISKSGIGLLESGMSVAVRAALISGEDFLGFLERCNPALDAEEIISRCISLESSYALKDGPSAGERMIMRMGDVFADIATRLSGFSISYCESLAIGLVMTLRASACQGFCSKSLLDRITALLERHGFRLNPDFSFSDIKAMVLKSNRFAKGYMEFAVPYAPGDCRLVKIELRGIDDWIRQAVEGA